MRMPNYRNQTDLKCCMNCMFIFHNYDGIHECHHARSKSTEHRFVDYDYADETGICDCFVHRSLNGREANER